MREGDAEGVKGFVLQAFEDQAALAASQAAQAGCRSGPA
jgi:hypothetical protein